MRGSLVKRPLLPRDIFVIRLQREIGSEQPFRAEIQHVPETTVSIPANQDNTGPV